MFCQILRYLSEKVQDLVDFEIGKMFMLYRTVNKLGANTQCYFQPIPGIRVNFQSKIHFIALSNRIFFACGAFFCLVQSPSAIFIPFQLFGTKVKKSVVLSNSTQPQDRTLSATLDSRPPRVPLFITRAGNVIICGSYLIRSEFRISHLQ